MSRHGGATDQVVTLDLPPPSADNQDDPLLLKSPMNGLEGPLAPLVDYTPFPKRDPPLTVVVLWIPLQ